MSTEEVSECRKEATSIQAIDKGSVHRICSGQVVLTLATAVKELVENSIDAGATSVEVKLKDYGSESIEVTDNGAGVEEVNFEGLTLKHHTSKLQDFEDLINVSTFGFRGEALSSLCALSNMVISTRHKAADIGTRLEFDLNGRIVSQKSTPRQIGTSVVVQNIFHTLPVRHKEFTRNLKKEFARLVQVLNAYCIVNTGVRITCSNQTTKGSRSTIVSTNGNSSMKDNIANVFGPKQLNSLLEFSQVEPDESTCSDFGLKVQQLSSANFRLEGFVSKCEHGQGRSTSDRQFIFINKRPCDAVKIVKLVNEVYHMYNRHQNPFISLNISMSKESVDVNVTPDKRQIFVEGERRLLAVIKSSLIQMFEPTTSVYKMHNVLAPQLTVSPKVGVPGQEDSPDQRSSLAKLSALSKVHSYPPSNPSQGDNGTDTLSKLKRSFSSAFARNESAVAASPSRAPKSSKMASLEMNKSSSLPSRFGSSNETGSITQFLSRYSPKKKEPKTDSRDSDESRSSKMCSPVCSAGTELDPEGTGGNDNVILVESDRKSFGSSTNTDVDNEIKCSEIEERSSVDGFPSCAVPERGVKLSVSLEEESQSQSNKAINEQLGGSEKSESISSSLPSEDMPATACSGEETAEADSAVCEDDLKEDVSDVSPHAPQQEGPCVTVISMDEQEDRQGQKEKTISFSMSSLRQKMLKKKLTDTSLSGSHRSFRAKICPGDNKSAEEELQKEISKDMFSRMEVLGQFNLGFIIAKLGVDLFIVDQHATDEKYNFEMLQRHTVLQSQKMILPQCLELTASNETILVDNLEVFKKNGFDFLIKPEAPPTERVQLISAPVSKNWTFGKDDIEELLFMLMDSPNVMCRPTRVRMMFASRACRKSIMIGTALKKSEMKRLVTHMGEIEQPWSCPHGRPTMRHLFNMDMLPT
ncbi:mismatch repair endonuclease PMS2 [Aplysia californica]|uniref:Mismatch repair endonuclease PMS2 n=1 Tax=Aplysia californica TaxID=6500 RepID=A0ABM1A3B1_APLCA|nr:mismatch repair endonuclease PMS2 [Aplysia californica]